MTEVKLGASSVPTKFILDKSAEDKYALVWAAHRGDKAEVVKLLEGSRCGIEDGDEDGSTPLIAAAWANKPEVVKELLARGANLAAKNTTAGWTALHAAAARGHLPAVIALLEGTALLGTKKIVYADPTLEDAHGHQPLVYAIHHGHDEVAKVISERLEKVEKDKKAEFDRVCPECAIM